MIGNFDERAAAGRNHPDVFVVAVIVFPAGAVGDEGDACGIGRPLRVAIVPVVAGGELLVDAGAGIGDPEVRPFIVEPAGVVEFVRDVSVVANVALAIFDVVAGSAAAHEDESFAVGRPLEGADPVLEVRQDLRFAAIGSEDADLRVGWFSFRGLSAAARKKRESRSIGTPTRRIGIGAFRGETAWSGLPVDIDHPYGRGAPVLFLIDSGDDVGDLFAIGRNMRVADIFKSEVIFGSHATLGKGGREGEGENRYRERFGQEHYFLGSGVGSGLSGVRR